MKRALLTSVVAVVFFVSLSSPQPLRNVACGSALVLLAAAPSSSLVERCDFGNHLVAIASNSTVVLRSTMLGGITFLGGVVVGNVSLTLANCSVVGLANPLDPFLGSYSNVLFTNVVTWLQENTVLRRNNASLQSGGGEGGMLLMSECNVSGVTLNISQSRCFTSNLSETALIHHRGALCVDNVALHINLSEVSVKGVGVTGGGDLVVMQVDAKDSNTASTLDLVNVSVTIVCSDIFVQSLSDPAAGLRLYSVFYLYNIRQNTMFRFVARNSSVTIGPVDSTERVPKWASLLSLRQIQDNSTIMIDRCVVRLQSSEWTAVLDVEVGSVRRSSVAIKSTVCVSAVRGLASMDVSERRSALVFINSSTSSSFDVANTSLGIQMGVGISGQASTLHLLEGYHRRRTRSGGSQ